MLLKCPKPLQVHFAPHVLNKPIQCFFKLLCPSSCDWPNWHLQWVVGMITLSVGLIRINSCLCFFFDMRLFVCKCYDEFLLLCGRTICFDHIFQLCLLFSFRYHVFNKKNKFKFNKSTSASSSSSVDDHVMNLSNDYEDASNVEVNQLRLSH